MCLGFPIFQTLPDMSYEINPNDSFGWLMDDYLANETSRLYDGNHPFLEAAYLRKSPELYSTFIETSILPHADACTIHHVVFDMVTWVIYHMKSDVFGPLLGRVIRCWMSMNRTKSYQNIFWMNHVFFQHFFANFNRLHVLIQPLKCIIREMNYHRIRWVPYVEKLVLHSERFSSMVFGIHDDEYFCEVDNCKNWFNETQQIKDIYPDYKPPTPDTLYRKICLRHHTTPPEKLVFFSPPLKWDKYIMSTRWVYVDSGLNALERVHDQTFPAAGFIFPTDEQPCSSVDTCVSSICANLYDLRNQYTSALLYSHIKNTHDGDFHVFLRHDVEPVLRDVLDRLGLDVSENKIRCYLFFRTEYHPCLHIVLRRN